MINCSICQTQFESIRKLSHHIRVHKITLQEYYDSYMKKSTEGICAVCGKKTSFRGLSEGYLECCSAKCSNNHNIDKIKRVKLARYGSSTYNNQAKVKETCLKRYGVSSVLKIPKVHENGIKAACSKESNDKREQTNLTRYGTTNVYASESIKNKIKQTNISKYGTEYVTQNPDIISKIKSTNLKRYGVVCNLNTDEIKKKLGTKEVQTKRANTLRGRPKHSKLESLFESKLNELGYIKDQDYYCQYRSEEYPYMCDFYFIKKQLYVEVNNYWMHGGHPFNEFNDEDINRLNVMKEKSKKSIAYKYAIHIWTESDVQKRTVAINNKLNFLELYTYDDINHFCDTIIK